MANKEVSFMVEGGKATPAPPIGPALAPLGVNTGKVVAMINDKTKGFSGMTVPVTVIIDMATKNFDVAVGTPPVSGLIKKDAKASKGSGAAGTQKVGNITLAQAVEIAKSKGFPNVRSGTKSVLGTCLSTGVTVDGKDPREVQKEIDTGKHDSLFK
jgi:large subunit ribosomal protein L11